MPYAPSVNDTSGQILANGITGAAQTKLAGIEALANGIESGASSAAGGIAKGYVDHREQARKYDALAGQLDALKVIAPKYGISDDDLASLYSEKNPDKAAGKLLVLNDYIQNAAQEQAAQRRVEANLEYQRQKAALWGQMQGSKPVNPNYQPLPIPDLPSDIDTSQ
jgi:hypothetical protein